MKQRTVEEQVKEYDGVIAIHEQMLNQEAQIPEYKVNLIKQQLRTLREARERLRTQ